MARVLGALTTLPLILISCSEFTSSAAVDAARGVKAVEQDQGAPDGGAKPVDGGAKATDGGAKATDGGAKATDGGAKATDGGAKATDGGAKPVDGGAKPTDGGAKPTDGGAGEIKIVMGAIQVEAPAAPAKPAKPAKQRKRTAAKREATKPEAAKPEAVKHTRGGSVMKTIKAHWSEVESCYGAVAAKDPSIGGKIVMQWTLGADGRPTTARVKTDTLKDKSVGRCIVARSTAWVFPPPSGGVGVVSYTYRLQMQ
ncbi:AgmX/PglI C-terminal domain-containing protein [Myxococcota bacterium]|nr:AgmX/PglI C-terminal domain-containing protein [Myxococcota bacterium]